MCVCLEQSEKFVYLLNRQVQKSIAATRPQNVLQPAICQDTFVAAAASVAASVSASAFASAQSELRATYVAAEFSGAGSQAVNHVARKP